MMASFSPFTRRLVAVGIALLALIGLINLVVLPVYTLTASSLSGLEDARFQRARLEAIAARPPLPRSEPVPASFYLTAPDRERAADALIAAIGSAAARYEVQVDSIAPVAGADPARPGAIAVTVAARGEHDRLLALINELERGTPAVYFPIWKLEQTEAGAAPSVEGAPPPALPAAAAGNSPLTLSLNATAVAVWEQRP
jgi:hypothetical protein